MRKIKIFTKSPFAYVGEFGEQDPTYQQLLILCTGRFIISRDNEKVKI